MAFYIDQNQCVGCGACRFACLFQIPKPDENKTKYTISETACCGCGQCENICPNSAIHPLPDHKRRVVVLIDGTLCKGCGRCAKVCQANAPQGEIGKPFVIDQDKCFRCGMCARACKFEAIKVQYEGE
jgi:NAD-dependent dihydropyrimidine dehydrogenase PreA subunit